MDESQNPFGDYDGYYQQKEKEYSQRKAKRVTERQAQYNRDNDLWETNRMLTSGVFQRSSTDTDFDDDNEVRMHFIDGRNTITDVYQCLAKDSCAGAKLTAAIS